MAITQSGVYWANQEKHLLNTADTSWEAAGVGYALVLDTSTSTSGNFDGVTVFSDASLNEVTGTTGYTSPGDTSLTAAVTISTGMKYDYGSDPQWTSSTIPNAMGGVGNSGNVTDTLNEVWYLHDFVTAVSSSSGTFDVTINASGAVTWA
jgi:hypothetical protein